MNDKEQRAFDEGRRAGRNDESLSKHAVAMGGRSSPLWIKFLQGYLQGRKDRFAQAHAEEKRKGAGGRK